MALVGVLAAIVALVPWQAEAEDEQQSTVRPIGGLTFVDEYELTVVNVAVSVTTRSGKPVTDLTREDFRVFQDGEEQPISNFALFTEEAYQSYLPPDEIPAPIPEASPTPAPPTDEPQIRPAYVVLYIDNQNIHPIHRNRMLNDVRQFVLSSLKPPVQMMVVSFQKSFKVLQPFTSDPRKVLDAVREVRAHTGGKPDRDRSRREVLDLMNRYIEEERLQAGSAQTRNTREYQELYGMTIAFAQQEKHDLAFTIDALRQMITSMSGLPGKKAIVYVSNGLPMVPGLELIGALSSTFADHGILGQIKIYDSTHAYNSLASTANAQDVSFYTIDVGGLRVDDTAFSAEYRSAGDSRSTMVGKSNYIDSLRFLADSTGGLAVVNTNDFERGLEKIETDIFTYYSIGYTIVPSGQDKIHRIKVTLPQHPEYELRFRQRFVEKSFETRTQDRVISALVFGVEDNPMQVEVATGNKAPAVGDRWTVPLHISFPLEKVALLPQGDEYVGRVTLYIAARDDDGKQSDLVRQEHDVRIRAEDYEDAKAKRFGISAALLMETGSYRLVVGLMDRVTRQASYSTMRTAVRD
jgi:VWFA-related protein